MSQGETGASPKSSLHLFPPVESFPFLPVVVSLPETSSAPLSPACVTSTNDKDTSGVQDPVLGEFGLVPDPSLQEYAERNIL